MGFMFIILILTVLSYLTLGVGTLIKNKCAKDSPKLQ